MNKLLIQGADVLQCEADGCRILRHHDIRIENNRITAVEPSGTSGSGRAPR